MAHEVYTRTNQAVFFARKAIASWRDAANSNALDAITQARYHREHALFHLYRAVLAVVHEVADRYRWPLMDVRTVEQVLGGDAAERFPGPELAELTELASMPDTWLGRLLAGWQHLQAPPTPMDSKPSDDSLIASSAVRSQDDWALEDAEEALQAIVERIGCYREGLVEW
ncbi:MAG TPA: PasA protein [Pseudomonas xinjiangensis]|uniref:PasA protein n=2 Tax=root TaxID=1 RepID=A0A7V1BQF3_9GAMM|nr:PasA protein [Halopseudomonas xinjiangensis]HEC46740.1 PasA protein [Halopseudomonas xinjiangensis]